jgi:hypothetical protein
VAKSARVIERANSAVSIADRGAATDFLVVMGFFLLCSATVPFVNPVLRRGHGFGMALAAAGYQFAIEGLAPLAIMAIRRERFSDYGFTRRNSAKSIVLGVFLALLYNAGMSFYFGNILWIPLRRQPAVRMSLAAGFPLSLVGITVTAAVWGFCEGFFGVFFAKKLNRAIGRSGGKWLSPGALGFALFNGLIHVGVGQGLEGFVTSLASGYAIAVIPEVTENAWGSPIVQTLTNSVGKL